RPRAPRALRRARSSGPRRPESRSSLAEQEVEIRQAERRRPAYGPQGGAADREERQQRPAAPGPRRVPEEAPAVARRLRHVVESSPAAGGQAIAERGVAPARAIRRELRIGHVAEPGRPAETRILVGEPRRQPLDEG